MSKTILKIWNVVFTLLVGAVVTLAVVLMGGRLLGWQAFTVISGSMEPTYHVGDLIYVRPVEPEDIRVGDVITFVMNEQLTVGTHRVVEIEQGESRLYFHTKGDANDTADAAPVAQENVVGSPVFALPMVGYLANTIQNPPGCYLAVAVCAALVALAFQPDILRRREKRRQAEIQAAVEKALAEERAKAAPMPPAEDEQSEPR